MPDQATVVTIIQAGIVLVFTGTGGGLFGVWLSHRRANRDADRADRAEDRADQTGLAELTQLLQQMSQTALEQARADLERARQEIVRTREQMEAREVEHRQVVGRMSRRIQQLVGVLVAAGLAVPDELPDEPGT